MKLVLSKEEIVNITKKFGQIITKKIQKEKKIPIVLGVMKGAMFFMHDVIKNISGDIFIDYIQISSYHNNQSTNKIILKKNISLDIKDKIVILLEDIIDTGQSAIYLLDLLKTYKPKKIIFMVLIDKRPSNFALKISVDYVGKKIKSDKFLIGYGLDLNEIGRNLPEIYEINKKEINEIIKKSEL